MTDTNFTQNRELSWLRFNERVLMEATDETVPLFERLKFVSIFTSNLDEFFMIRVGSLIDLMHLKENSIDNKSGLTPAEQLERIYAEVHILYEKRREIFKNLKHQLSVHSINDVSFKELTNEEEKFIKQYFKSSVAPILSPQIIDTHHPFPHLQNNVLHIGTMLCHKSKLVFGVIPIPSVLPDIVFLPGKELRFIRTEEIIYAYLDQIFTTYSINERVIFRVTRNADINPDDDSFEFSGSDFRKKMKKLLNMRKRLAPVRLELSEKISDNLKDYLCEKLSLTPEKVFITDVPLKMNYVFEIIGKLDSTKKAAITYNEFVPQPCAEVIPDENMIKQILKKDILLSYPFESMQPFLQLLKEAAYDPHVVSIKITIYRLASKAKIVDYLCAAAENGKDVTVLIELRARFDEASNISRSEQLEEAGCNVIYGFEDYKVHSKICLITRKSHNDIKYITQIGTGNYNEKTAEMYTDVSLMTSNRKIGEDANEFFKNMCIGNLNGSYNSLLVSPVSLKSSIIKMIDEQASLGSNGKIVIKINSITDIDIIEKLKQASCAGVQIYMIVRGICCILPEVPQKTENIHIRSIVGRFLEHSRIYCFGTGENEKIFISSADFMTRNTERRVEVACPIYDADVKAKLHNIIDLCLSDNSKARIMRSSGLYEMPKTSDKRIESQQELMNQAVNAKPVAVKHEASFTEKIESFIGHLFK